MSLDTGHRVRKTSRRMADGREIIYYDESPGLGRAKALDRRPLGYWPAGPGEISGPDENLSPSGLRWDALAGEWVIIAAQRQDRTFLPPPEECPLDPSREGRLTEIPADDYDVVVFENRGEEIGVTLSHPHGQIYGYPFVTPRTERMLRQARAHAAAGRANLFDELVAGELAAGIRVVGRNEHWIAFVPAAARWPYEVVLFPARRVASLPDLTGAARQAFCTLYLDVLRRLDALFGMPLPYIAAWHQAPGGDPFARQEFGLHLQVLSIRRAPGKLKYLAGSESGMGVWINDVLPEDAARRLREAG